MRHATNELSLIAIAPSPDPLQAHHPITITCSPNITTSATLAIPPMKVPNTESNQHGEDFDEFAVDMHEWLSLAILESPRIHADDKIDPFLSRYTPPTPQSHPSAPAKLVKISWQGFLASAWVHHAFVQTLLSAGSHAWFFLNTSGFHDSWSADSVDTTILRLPAANEYILWEVAQN